MTDEADDRKPPRKRKRGIRKEGEEEVFFPLAAMDIEEKDAEFPHLTVPWEKFGRVRTVLVETKFPGNIGQAARVLRNLGFDRLILVRPRCMVDAESEKMAVGAEDMLDGIQVFDSLSEALSGVRIVAGTSRRKGVQRRNVLDPRAMAEMAVPVLDVGEIAMVFGPEDRGLTNEDLAMCNWMVSIPTGSDRPSFNLSHAVAVVLYEIAYSLLMPLPRNIAKHENLEHMFDHLQKFLDDIGFLMEDDPARMMLLFRQMLFRAGLSEREVRTIRGVIRQAYWRINNPEKK